MKVIRYFLLIILIFTILLLPTYALVPEQLKAESAVLIDADTGQVLFEKNMSKTMFPASTTKIMTALLAVENTDLSARATVTQDVVDDVPRYTSHIALTDGEVISIDDALYALMLPSANDAADVIAMQIGVDFDKFSVMMNDRANAIGAENTNFTNAHGLHDESHYTTAYDLAMITREASKNPLFMKYFGTARYTMSPTNRQKEARPFTNQQFMLINDMWVYNPDVQGGKVGFTTEAGYTMATVAQKNGRQLVAVVLKSGYDERFDDTQLMFDFGFDEFVPYTIAKEKLATGPVPIKNNDVIVGSALLKSVQDITVLVHNSLDVDNIKFVPNYPGAFLFDEKIDANMTIEIPVQFGTGLSDILAKAPLSATVSLPQTISESEKSSSIFALPLLSKLFLTIATIIIGIIILTVIFVLLEKHRIMKRRVRSRLRRQQAISQRKQL